VQTAFVAILLLSKPVLADGLIYQLPPDGTFVEFRGDGEAEIKVDLPQEILEKMPAEAKKQLNQLMKLRYLVTLSSVGQQVRAGQTCRWIELNMRSDRVTDSDNLEPVGENILKVLVPEKFLKRGEDPLAHASLAFFNPKGADKAKIAPEPGFNRIQYEIDRVRTVFPEPLQSAQKLPVKTLATEAGRFNDCEVIAGKTAFDRPLAGGGRWEFENEWQITLHKDAPFGVVEVQCRSKGQEVARRNTAHITTKYVITLAKIGTDAKSAIAEERQLPGAKTEGP
jgi:hypothetical protein